MWQLELFKYSFKKKEKLRILQEWLTNLNGKLCLDLGSSKGTLSYFLKNYGGKWIHADLDYENLVSSKELLVKNIIQISQNSLPFNNNSFDLIVSLDYLEHLDDDLSCLVEINRITKLNGKLIISTPASGELLFLNKIKPFIGLSLEKYGHKRVGYSINQLKDLLKASGFSVVKAKGYSFILTEAVEMFLNFIFINIEKRKIKKRDGFISPSSINQLSAHKIAFSFYKFFYPFLWIFSRLDYLLKFFGAYAIIIEAKKLYDVSRC